MTGEYTMNLNDLLLPGIGLTGSLVCLLLLLRLRRKISGSGTQGRTVDPLREAEVYLAYGRQRDAIETLRKGLTAHPNRADIATKLAALEQKT